MKILTHKWFAPVLIVLMLIASTIAYDGLPEIMPVQWGLDGEVTNEMDKLPAVLLMPGITLLVWLLLVVLPVIDPRRQSYEQFRPTYERLKGIVVLFLFMMHLVMLTRYDDPDVLTRLALGGAALMVAFIANELPRIRQTWFVGIRTPWTLSSDTVWRQTHRLGGQVLFWTSLFNLLLIIFVPIDIAVIIFVATLISASLGLIAYSYVLFQREQQSA